MTPTRLLLKAQDLILKPLSYHSSRFLYVIETTSLKKPYNKLLKTDYNNLQSFFIDLDLVIRLYLVCIVKYGYAAMLPLTK